MEQAGRAGLGEGSGNVHRDGLRTGEQAGRLDRVVEADRTRPGPALEGQYLALPGAAQGAFEGCVGHDDERCADLAERVDVALDRSPGGDGSHGHLGVCGEFPGVAAGVHEPGNAPPGEVVQGPLRGVAAGLPGEQLRTGRP